MTDTVNQPAGVGPVQVRCIDMEDYARIYNDGFAEALEQFGELLGDARQDLAPEASAGDLMSWLDNAVEAMKGADRRPAEASADVIERIAEVLYAEAGTLRRVMAWDRAYPIVRRPYLELAEKVLALTSGAGS